MKKRFSPKKTAAFCTVSVLLALIIWTVWGNTALMVSTAAISSSRIPPAFSGFRIAQVSDLHNAEFGKKDFYTAKVPKNAVKWAFFGTFWCLVGV